MTATPHKHPNYIAVFIGLAVLTAIELGVAFLPWSKLTIILVLIFLALWKAVMVALYYMLLKSEGNPIKIMAVSPLPLAVIMVLAVITEFRW
jgi:caa(3)-type oxidase subunit IV